MTQTNRIRRSSRRVASSKELPRFRMQPDPPCASSLSPSGIRASAVSAGAVRPSGSRSGSQSESDQLGLAEHARVLLGSLAGENWRARQAFLDGWRDYPLAKMTASSSSSSSGWLAPTRTSSASTWSGLQLQHQQEQALLRDEVASLFRQTQSFELFVSERVQSRKHKIDIKNHQQENCSSPALVDLVLLDDHVLDVEMLVDQVEMFLHPLKIRTRKIKHTHQKYLKRTRQAGGASGGGGVVQASGRTALTVVDEGVVLELLHDFYCSAGGVVSKGNAKSRDIFVKQQVAQEEQQGVGEQVGGAGTAGAAATAGKVKVGADQVQNSDTSRDTTTTSTTEPASSVLRPVCVIALTSFDLLDRFGSFEEPPLGPLEQPSRGLGSCSVYVPTSSSCLTTAYASSRMPIAILSSTATVSSREQTGPGRNKLPPGGRGTTTTAAGSSTAGETLVGVSSSSSTTGEGRAAQGSSNAAGGGNKMANQRQMRLTTLIRVLTREILFLCQFKMCFVYDCLLNPTRLDVAMKKANHQHGGRDERKLLALAPASTLATGGSFISTTGIVGGTTKNSSQQTKRADLQHVVQELFIGGHLDDLAGKLFRLCPICTRKLHYLLGPRSDPLERFWYLGKHLRALFPKEGELAMEQAQAVGCPTHCVGGSAGGGGVGMADVGVAGGSRGRETESRG